MVGDMVKQSKPWLVVALMVAIAVTAIAVFVAYGPKDQKPVVAVMRPSLAADVPEIGLMAYEGKLRESRRLIESGIDLEGAGADKRSALLLAAAGGNVDAVTILLKAGAKPKTVDVGGMTPLHWGVVRGNVEIVRLLLAHGSVVNAQNENGETPLILAAIHGQRVILVMLLRAGAEPALSDRDGNDAQEWARKNRYPEIMEELQSHVHK